MRQAATMKLKFAAAAALLLLSSPPGSAHDFYSSWMRNDGKGSCCNNQDCAPAAAERRGAHWYVKHHGMWMEVPDNVVLRKSTPDGQAHACILGNVIICFVEPILA
jgi:hypothetical protein